MTAGRKLKFMTKYSQSVNIMYYDNIFSDFARIEFDCWQLTVARHVLTKCNCTNDSFTSFYCFASFVARSFYACLQFSW